MSEAAELFDRQSVAEFSRRQSILNRSLITMGVIHVIATVLWVRLLLNGLPAVTLLLIVSVPTLDFVFAVVTCLLFSWAVAAVPSRTRKWPTAWVITVVVGALVLVGTVLAVLTNSGEPLQFRIYVGCFVAVYGGALLAVVVKGLDYLGVALRVTAARKTLANSTDRT